MLSAMVRLDIATSKGGQTESPLKIFLSYNENKSRTIFAGAAFPQASPSENGSDMSAGMLSAIIKAEEVAEPLARTLATLVPAVAEGVLREAQVIAPGHGGPVEAVADAAGCDLVIGSGSAVLVDAVARARAAHVLLLAAGTELEHGWWEEVSAWISRQGRTGMTAAVFRPVATSHGPGGQLWEHAGFLLQRLTRRPSPGQGLVMGKALLSACINADDRFPPRPAGKIVTLRSRAWRERA
jgi:hypothetical protein